VQKLTWRLKEHDLAAGGLVLKPKTRRFAQRIRMAKLISPDFAHEGTNVLNHWEMLHDTLLES
jgi:hypothetical protein